MYAFAPAVNLAGDGTKVGFKVVFVTPTTARSLFDCHTKAPYGIPAKKQVPADFSHL
jgi:hypothetical protein